MIGCEENMVKSIGNKINCAMTSNDKPPIRATVEQKTPYSCLTLPSFFVLGARRGADVLVGDREIPLLAVEDGDDSNGIEGLLAGDDMAALF